MSQSLPILLNAGGSCHQAALDDRLKKAASAATDARGNDAIPLQAFPNRAAWRDSDSAWRRRMLAGVWILVLVPLVPTLQAFGWASRIAVPTFFAVQGKQSIQESFVLWIYPCLAFVIGAVLLFSREKQQHPSKLDWTRRWGVISSYSVAVLSIPQFAMLGALVMLGISSMLLTLPPENQPAVTDWLAKVSFGYVHYGPDSSELCWAALTGSSSMVVLLSCVPLFNALRSSGPKVWAAVLLSPLALSAMTNIAFAALHAVDLSGSESTYVYDRLHFFVPATLARGFAGTGSSIFDLQFLVEAAKWSACLGIAVWLSIAQFAALCRSGKVGHDAN